MSPVSSRIEKHSLIETRVDAPNYNLSLIGFGDWEEGLDFFPHFIIEGFFVSSFVKK